MTVMPWDAAPLLDIPKVKEEDRRSEDIIVKDATKLIVRSEPFDFSDPQMDPMELSRMLVEQMVDSNGLGLSAIQIGIPLRVCAIRANPKNIVMFNPNIVNFSEEKQFAEEGCLSFPHLLIPVERSIEIRVRFKWPNQEVQTEKWRGLTARVVQHEVQHMDGEAFFKGLSRYKLDKAIKFAKKFGTDYTTSGLHRFR
jgi:peptide deformylase